MRVKRVKRERQFQRCVVDYARENGWLVYHTHRTQVRQGCFITPVYGDSGFPDLVLSHPVRKITLIVELKQDGRYPRSDQYRWLVSLFLSGITVCIWRPSDLDVIREYLTNPSNPIPSVFSPSRRHIELVVGEKSEMSVFPSYLASKTLETEGGYQNP
ncbi:MAG: hypothetical protein KatS3mg087_2104 [Patescibacteria group bacterium]|nr:MAG: hypothetical protein KatS3mg087_2104 [Patescibacteria group bacterium]